ncbi:MAG: hypothetical protein K0Q59_3623 [Paenibacillus sp.]|jgi:hypothetical protein|nr:hypothetical protein [Paenibacillus sp.]
MSKSNVSSFLSLLFMALIVYGMVANVIVSESKTEQLNFEVFNWNPVKDTDVSITVVQEELSAAHGAHNGIAVSGRAFWGFLKAAWYMYVDWFPENIILKLIWLIVGLFITLTIALFIAVLVFFIWSYKLLMLGGADYKMAFMVSSLVVPALFVLIRKLSDHEDTSGVTGAAGAPLESQQKEW